MQSDVELVAEGGNDLRRLALAHESGIHKHRVQLVSDSPVNQGSGNRGIHPAADGGNDAVFANL